MTLTTGAPERMQQICPASPGAERIPLYSGGKLSGFVRRAASATTPGAPATEQSSPGIPLDRSHERAIAAAWQDEAGSPPPRIGVSVVGGVVHLSGAVDTVHDRMALARIAASIKETRAIVDDLWVCCE